jgi:hypothetical protein
VFPADAQSLLQLIYKNESLPLDLRMRAAEMANTRERPALEEVDKISANMWLRCQSQ